MLTFLDMNAGAIGSGDTGTWKLHKAILLRCKRIGTIILACCAQRDERDDTRGVLGLLYEDTAISELRKRAGHLAGIVAAHGFDEDRIARQKLRLAVQASMFDRCDTKPS